MAKMQIALNRNKKAIKEHTISVEDGVRIAEADLELRGAGEILGTRQTGDIFFKIAELPRDASLLTQAKKDAKNIIDNDPGYGKELVRNWLSKAEDFSLA